MNRQRFINICKLTQNGVKKFVKNQVKTMSRKGFLYHKGTLPILLVCHMDTVHKKQPRKINGRTIISSPQGIGGDDRCGVYAVLEILKKYDCHAVFTEDEEVGCVGADFFARSNLARRIKDKMLFAIELDRKGNKDAVFYECDNEKFTEFVTKEYWEEDYGSFTDICEICPEINCAGVNLSTAYYKQHTTDEFVNLVELDEVIDETCKLIERGLKDNVRYEYIKREYKFDWNRYRRMFSYDYFGTSDKRYYDDEWDDNYTENGYPSYQDCIGFVIYDKQLEDYFEIWAMDEEEAIWQYLEDFNPCAHVKDLQLYLLDENGDFRDNRLDFNASDMFVYDDEYDDEFEFVETERKCG